MMRFKSSLFVIIALFSTSVVAQITVRTNSFNSVGGTKIAFNKDITIQGSLASLGAATLIFNGQNQSFSSEEDFTINRLVIEGGGTKTFVPNTKVISYINLTEGFIQGEKTFSFAGSPAFIENASEASYVIGHFSYDRNNTPITSTLLFPLGAQAGAAYTPLLVEGVNGGTLVEATVTNGDFESDVAPLTLPVVVTEASSNYYWQIKDVNQDYSGGQIVLPFTDADKSIFDDFDKPVVLQAEDGGSVVNLENDFLSASIADNTVYSKLAGTSGYFLIGRVVSVSPIVHNILSPNGDAINDYLFVENIDRYPENEIALVDRWGVTVFEATNYTNANPEEGIEGADFTFLPPGNYVCIFRYEGGTQTIKQTITVAK